MLNRISIALIFMQIGFANAQVDISIGSLLEVHEIPDLWDFELASTTANPILIKVTLTVYNDNEDTYYIGSIDEMVLQPNQRIHSINYTSRIVDEKVEFPVDTLLEKIKGKERSLNLIPKGNYIACISVFANESKIELSRSCQEFTVSGLFIDSIIALGASKWRLSKLDPHVQVQAFSYFDFPQNSSSQLVHRNSGVYVSPSFTAWGLPLSASVFLDTDSDAYYTSANTLQLDFDANTYKQNLENRLVAIANAKGTELASKCNQYAEMFSDLDNLQNLMTSHEAVSLLHLNDSLQILEQYANDSTILVTLQTELGKYSDSTYVSGLMDSLDCDSNKVASLIEEKRNLLITHKDSVMAKIEQGEALVAKIQGYADSAVRMQKIQELISGDTLIGKAYESYTAISSLNPDDYTNPDYVKGKLLELDAIRKYETLLAGINQFQVGMTTPEYSEFSITGVVLNGANMQYATGNHTFFGTIGRIHDNSSLFTLDRYRQTYSKLYGLGTRYKIGESLEYGFYVVQSDFNDGDSMDYYNFLEENNVISNTLTGTICKGKVKVNSELAISYARNKDFSAFDGDVTPAASHSFWVIQAISQQDNLENGSFSDKAAKVEIETKVDHGRTILHGSARFLGEGFYTPGNPFLLNDNFALEVGFARNFFKNKISTDFSIIQTSQLPDSGSSITSSYYNINGRLTLAIPKLPTINIIYQPNVIVTNEQLVQVEVVSGFTQYAYRLFGSLAQISVSLMDVKSKTSIESSNYKSSYYTVNHTYTLNQFDITAGWNLNSTYSSEFSFTFQTYTAGVNWTIGDRFSVNGSMNLVNESNTDVFKPGGQCEFHGSIIKGLSIIAGYFYLPIVDAFYLTTNENLSNQTTYITIAYNF